MTKRWTIIRLSGQAYMECGYGSAAESGKLARDYFGVLYSIYTEMRQGGCNYDHPNVLMADGKVVIADNLSSIAYGYGKELDDAVQKARDEVKKKHDRGLT